VRAGGHIHCLYNFCWVRLDCLNNSSWARLDRLYNYFLARLLGMFMDFHRGTLRDLSPENSSIFFVVLSFIRSSRGHYVCTYGVGHAEGKVQQQEATQFQTTVFRSYAELLFWFSFTSKDKLYPSPQSLIAIA
jgi:hypothetical protein